MTRPSRSEFNARAYLAAAMLTGVLAIVSVVIGFTGAGFSFVIAVFWAVICGICIRQSRNAPR